MCRLAEPFECRHGLDCTHSATSAGRRPGFMELRVPRKPEPITYGRCMIEPILKRANGPDRTP